MTVQNDAPKQIRLSVIVADKLSLNGAIDNLNIDDFWLLAQPLSEFLCSVKATDGSASEQVEVGAKCLQHCPKAKVRPSQ